MGNSPVVIIEICLVFGGVLVWGLWQLRTLRKENEMAAQRERERAGSEVRSPASPEPGA